MSATSSGRVLRIALAASLAVHLVFAAVVYSRPVTAAPEQVPQHTDIIRMQLPKPTPTPPPPKPALPHPQPSVAALRPPVRIPHVTPVINPKGPSIPPPPVQPTGNPNPIGTTGPVAVATSGPVAPTPTPKPACSAPDVPARTIAAQQPEEPQDASAQGLVGTAKIEVSLDQSGKITGARVYASTGSMELDQAALQAARQSTYAPEERNCKNVPGSYLFTVDFQ